MGYMFDSILGTRIDGCREDGNAASSTPLRTDKRHLANRAAPSARAHMDSVRQLMKVEPKEARSGIGI